MLQGPEDSKQNDELFFYETTAVTFVCRNCQQRNKSESTIGVTETGAVRSAAGGAEGTLMKSTPRSLMWH
jgi:hypothetical protein